MEMEKEARKKSPDPKQENIRSLKDKYNSGATEMIKRMIAFKRALNGRGDAHYSLPPSKITEPLPESIVSFLHTLTSNFEQLASAALEIQRAQADYAQNRRKAQPKNPNSPNPGAPKVASASSKNGEVKIGNHQFPTLLAITSEEQELGLMYREYPPPVMSFVYSAPTVNRFWMKNTPSPLDIVFARDNKVIAIHKGEPYSTKLIGDWEPSDLVVELPYGTCAQLNIQIGNNIALIK